MASTPYWWCPSRVTGFLPVARFQTLILRGPLPPAARVLPSALSTTNGLGSCDMPASRRVVSLRVATSHSLTYLLPLPEASVLPSGGNARESTPLREQIR